MKWVMDSKEAFLAQAIAVSLEERPYALAGFLGRAVSIGILTMEQAEECWEPLGFGFEPAHKRMLELAQRGGVRE